LSAASASLVPLTMFFIFSKETSQVRVLKPQKGEKVKKFIEDRGCQLLYLPPYSPDLNPIEEEFSKVKRFLRMIGAQTRDALLEATGKALNAVSAKDAKSFFTHCGYREVEQQL